MPNVAQQQEIRRKLRAMLGHKPDVSQNNLATMTEVSTANISHILSGRTDKAISEEIWNRAATPLGELNDLELVETNAFQTVCRECERARNLRGVVCVLGEAGFGKTSALRRYFLTTPYTYYVAFDGSMSRREFFLDVARALAVDLSGRPTLNQLIRRCADKLNATTGSLLLIDEVSNMQPEKLNYLRALRERTLNHAGIVLAGVNYFRGRLDRQAERQREGVPEFVSRIAHYQVLAAPSRRELLAVCETNGVGSEQAKEVVRQASNYRVLSNWIKQQRLALDQAATPSDN